MSEPYVYRYRELLELMYFIGNDPLPFYGVCEERQLFRLGDYVYECDFLGRVTVCLYPSWAEIPGLSDEPLSSLRFSIKRESRSFSGRYTQISLTEASEEVHHEWLTIKIKEPSAVSGSTIGIENAPYYPIEFNYTPRKAQTPSSPVPFAPRYRTIRPLK